LGAIGPFTYEHVLLRPPQLSILTFSHICRHEISGAVDWKYNTWDD
jgi:hypothetical protein